MSFLGEEGETKKLVSSRFTVANTSPTEAMRSNGIDIVRRDNDLDTNYNAGGSPSPTFHHPLSFHSRMTSSGSLRSSNNVFLEENTPSLEIAERIMESATYVRSCQETISTLKSRGTNADAWTEYSGWLKKRSVSQHDNINRLNLRFFTLTPNIPATQSASKKRRPSALLSYYTKDPLDNKSIKPRRSFVLTRDTFIKEEGSLGFSLWNENFEKDEEPTLIIELKVENGDMEERDSWIEHLNYTIRLCKTKEIEDR